jgi:antitoxin Phd
MKPKPKPKPKPMSARETVAPFRNRRGELVEMSEISATDAKHELGRVLDAVAERGAIAITRHDTPRAILISVDEFNALVEAREPRLETLSDEFDALLAGMQAPRARIAMKHAFGASPAQLGRAAVAAARKRA